MSATLPPATPPSPTGYLPPLYSRLDITPRRRRSSVSSSGSSSSGSSDSWTSSRHAHEDQLQWDESIRQLQLIFSVVALPFVAKWAGRKFAYWAFGRYQDLGLGRRFWLGPLDGLVRRWS